MTTPCTDGDPMHASARGRGANLRCPPPGRVCGARSRRTGGAPCRTRTVAGRPRSRMHGGTSRRGFASPTLRHGRYSRCFWTAFVAALNARRAAQEGPDA